MDVVVVESPAKAKTINKYLGSDYKVLASVGHVRDLVSKDGSVQPDDNFRMVWTVDPRAEKNIQAIQDAIQGAEHLYLATDPDREGEAISWHVQEILNEREALEGIDVKRVVFHEVTKNAVIEALANPRELNQELIDAYLARRALDYLVGFSLSPVLWRKLPGSRSAGRVQSVALRLICEREAEIEVFKPQEYWTIGAEYTTTDGKKVPARLTHLNGKKLDRYDIANEDAAKAAVLEIERHDYKVKSVERKTVNRRAAPPFTTSTMQQEASRKLGFGATRTMRTAQKLYEGVDIGGETVGLITYMRTDSVNMAQEAVVAVRAAIGQDYGHEYVPDSPNTYRNKSKNAQEAHEAVRPTGFGRRPHEVRQYLGEDERKLYDLIWKRAVASQMEAAIMEQVAVDIASPDGNTVLRANGSVVKFDGFLKLYQEGQDERAATINDDETDGNDRDRILPPMSEGDAMTRGPVTPEQHFTKPPPRYTEASLVRKMEELGIGRPSTYASILQVLQDRNYVVLEQRRFTPHDRGRMVVAFLAEFFERYVEYGFTADLENSLDDVSNGDMEWKVLLSDFWKAFSAAIDETKELRITHVIDKLDAELGPHFFPEREDGSNPRKCLSCKDGRLGLKLGRNGGFIGCSNYPDCGYTTTLRVVTGDEDEDEVFTGPKELGTDPETGLPVSMRKGPFGVYVQLGEAEKGSKKKPKRQSLLRGMVPSDIDLELALTLLSLPRPVGPHPESGDMIVAGVGRFGPYLKVGDRYVKLGTDDDVLTVGLNRAVTIIAEAPARRGAAKTAGKVIGRHPEDGKPIELRDGRYGPYVKHGKINASLPRDLEPEALSLELAVEVIAARAEKVGAKKAAKKKAKKAKKAKGKKAKSKAKTKSKSAAKAQSETPPASEEA
ncbi:MAG: type I DNA topoisomerase [Rhodospirillaceae bacterium TMED63]|nr:DNA topoisomerase I [Rhodospirillaceae bacterium]RPF95975.1 MAG: type I DNA topoisomerase [Rhodospirillaceae bacterium TMED63]